MQLPAVRRCATHSGFSKLGPSPPRPPLSTPPKRVPPKDRMVSPPAFALDHIRNSDGDRTRRDMMRRLWTWLYRVFVQLWPRLTGTICWSRKRFAISATSSSTRRHPIQPKPTWARHEVIRLKSLLPQAGCRTIAHHFNRRWAARRAMTVSKTYVADTCRKHQYLIKVPRRKLKHRVPRPIPRNRVWGCDLLVKTDRRVAHISGWRFWIMKAGPVCDCSGSRTNRRGRCYRNSRRR